LASFKEIPLRDINMLKIAEQVGGFMETFETLKLMYEDYIFRKKKLKSMMIYPSIVIFVAFSIIVLMLMFVFPKFVEIYSQFDIQLPLPTKIMLILSDFLQHHAILFF
jgi:type IV pilus assembly protein PilC